MGVALPYQTEGIGRHLGHAGILFLMLALIARPICDLWQQPLKHRRAIGIFAFAATLPHAIYAFYHVLNCDSKAILNIASRY